MNYNNYSLGTKLEKENINVKAALIHVVGDFQRRFQVIFTALIIY